MLGGAYPVELGTADTSAPVDRRAALLACQVAVPHPMRPYTASTSSAIQTGQSPDGVTHRCPQFVEVHESSPAVGADDVSCAVACARLSMDLSIPLRRAAVRGVSAPGCAGYAPGCAGSTTGRGSLPRAAVREVVDISIRVDRPGRGCRMTRPTASRRARQRRTDPGSMPVVSAMRCADGHAQPVAGWA